MILRWLADRRARNRRWRIEQPLDGVASRFWLELLDDRPIDRDEVIDLLERRFPWFTIDPRE